MAVIQTDDFKNAASDLGGAVTALFGARGADSSAASFEQAAGIAEQNARIAATSTAIKETQLSRQIFQTIGTQRAQVGGAGFANKGTALDLLRSSASQGALNKALVAEQGAISENSYAEQAGMFMGMSRSASSSSTAQTVGGVLQGAGGLYNLYNGASKLFNGTTAATAAENPWAVASGVGGQVATDLTMGGTSVVLDAVGDAVGDAVVGSVVDAAVGDSIIGTAIEVGTLVGWIVCTELNRQGRLPNRWYAPGARRFERYDESSKRGYYLWATHAVAHLKKHPASTISNTLEWVFNHRAEYIAAQAGVRGARKTFAGWAMLAGVYAICWTLGRTVAREYAYA